MVTTCASPAGPAGRSRFVTVKPRRSLPGRNTAIAASLGARTAAGIAEPTPALLFHVFVELLFPPVERIGNALIFVRTLCDEIIERVTRLPHGVVRHLHDEALPRNRRNDVRFEIEVQRAD